MALTGTQGKDHKDAHEIKEGEKVKSGKDFVNKIRQWETQDDLCQTDDGQEWTSRVDKNGNGNDNS